MIKIGDKVSFTTKFGRSIEGVVTSTNAKVSDAVVVCRVEADGFGDGTLINCLVGMESLTKLN